MSIKPHKAMHRIKLPQFVTLIIFWSLKFSKFLSASLGTTSGVKMAYVPPHKRHLKETERPLLMPELLAPQFKKNLNVKPSKFNVDTSSKSFLYTNRALSRFYTVGLDDQSQFPSTVKLEPISLDSTEWNNEEKPIALINSCLDNEWKLPKSPWVSIAEIALDDLFSAYKNARNQMECGEHEEFQLNLVAKVGKILFHRTPSMNLESIRQCLDTETLRKLKKSFFANVPLSYKENIVKEVVPKIGVELKGEKELYYVKLSDSRRPKSIITCKCSVAKEYGKLQLYKMDLDPLRNMVTNISCLNKNLDLRLMLCTNKIVTAFADDEMQRIRDVINSAILDSNVKGGLRWPLGKAFSGGRYNVVGIWHTFTTTYENPSLKLKLRHANRFDFTTSAGETGWEVRLFLKMLVSKLQEENVEVRLISDMLQENVKLIWDNFLCCEPFLT